MSLELEGDLIGEPIHLVPTVDPGEYCNAKKKMSNEDGYKTNSDGHILFAGYCNAEAGKGTDHFGEGRCHHHAGSVPEGKSGAPPRNQNAQTHSLTADPHHYTENLSPEREQAIQQDTDVILDRIRKNHGREPDALDVKLARRVSIKLDMVAKASKYVEDVSGLVQVITREGGSHEEKAALLEEIRRFDNAIIGNLKDLGVLEDPKSKEVNEMGEWRKFLEGGDGDGMDAAETEDEDVIDVDSTDATDSD
jgi:hypothetical protein